MSRLSIVTCLAFATKHSLFIYLFIYFFLSLPDVLTKTTHRSLWALGVHLFGDALTAHKTLPRRAVAAVLVG
jgi:hypothetical protein